MQTFKGDVGTLASMGGGFALIGVLIFIMALLDGSAAREILVSSSPTASPAS